jgi:hypothetical protein
MISLLKEVKHSEKSVTFFDAMLLKNEIDRCKAHQKVLDARLYNDLKRIGRLPRSNRKEKS